jgi:hypothetical protein
VPDEPAVSIPYATLPKSAYIISGQLPHRPNCPCIDCDTARAEVSPDELPLRESQPVQ